MRRLRLSALLSLVVTLACGGDDSPSGPGGPIDPPPPPPPPPPVAVSRATGVFMRDISNVGDGTDLEVTFRRPDSSDGISEFRVIAVKASKGAGFDVPAASAVLSGRFKTVSAGTGDVTLNLGGITDSDGAAIQELATYVAFVFSVPDGVVAVDGALSLPSQQVFLEQTDFVVTLTDVIQAGSGGMATDAAGFIYMGDFGTSVGAGGVVGTQVIKVDPNSGAVSVFATGLVGASGNQFDSQGNLFQSNIGANRISRITPDGQVTTFANTNLSNPVGIAIDANGDLTVANCGNGTLARITSEGTTSIFATSPLFACANGIALADDGNFYVANFGNGNVIRVSPTGQATVFATFPGGNLGHITWANGRLYVVARAAHQIFELKLDGTSQVIAGTGVRGLKDGPALRATLSLTNDIAVSPDGKTLYFNDVVPPTPPETQTVAPTVIRMLRLEVNR